MRLELLGTGLDQLRWSLDNLRRMSASQILARLYKKSYFRWLAGLDHRLRPARVGPRKRARRAAAGDRELVVNAAAWLEKIVGAAPPRYLFSPADARAHGAYLRAHHRRAVGAIIAEGDRWLRGEVHLLGRAPVRIEVPLEWCRWPDRDREWIWSLNRLPFIEPLAKAWLLSGRRAYARALRGLLADWIAHARPGAEECFESYSIARRILRMAFALFAVHPAEIFGASFAEEFLASFLGQAHKLAEHLEFENPTNHLLLNAQALYFAGTLFGEYRPAQSWRRRGLELFQREVMRQVGADGVHREQCTGYHLGVLEKIGEVLALAERRAEPLDAEFRERCRAAFLFATQAAAPDGRLPTIGDSPPRRIEEVAASGASLFSDARLQPFEARIGEADLWRFDNERRERFARLRRDRLPGRLFSGEISGYLTYRTSWDEDALHLVFNAGPIGHPANPGHGHADGLAFTLQRGAQPILIDPGVASYERGSWLKYFQSTRAHNTVAIDGRDQCVLWAGGRRKAFLSRAHLLHHGLCGGRLEVLASCAAWRRRGVSHRRALLLEGGRWLFVWDRLRGRANARAQAFWHLAPGALAHGGDATLRWRAENGAGEALIALLSSHEGGSCSIVEGVSDPLQGWLAEGFGTPRPAPVLVHESQIEGGLDLLLVMDTRPGASCALSAAWVAGQIGCETRVRAADRAWRLRWDEGEAARPFLEVELGDHANCRSHAAGRGAELEPFESRAGLPDGLEHHSAQRRELRDHQPV